MNKILLFDIDGTLLRIHRGFMHRLIGDIMDQAGFDVSLLKSTPFAGRTDHSIFKDLLGEGPNTDTNFRIFKRRYVAAVREKLQEEDITVFPHVERTLEFCRDQGHTMGLLTGNFREIASCKLRLTKLHPYFSFGAFGCDHYDRNKLGPVAQTSYTTKHGKEASPDHFVVIGDTPLDIACARAFGCSCIAVATGNYSVSELRPFAPDLVLEDLGNPAGWLSEL